MKQSLILCIILFFLASCGDKVIVTYSPIDHLHDTAQVTLFVGELPDSSYAPGQNVYLLEKYNGYRGAETFDSLGRSIPSTSDGIHYEIARTRPSEMDKDFLYVARAQRVTIHELTPQ